MGESATSKYAPPAFCNGGVKLLPNFQKVGGGGGGGLTGPVFRGGLLGKRGGVTFFKEGGGDSNF